MTPDSEHVWQVGDLCTTGFWCDRPSCGVVCRVERVVGNHLLIRAIHTPFHDDEPVPQSLHVSDCVPLTLLDMLKEYNRLGLLITEEAKKNGA